MTRGASSPVVQVASLMNLAILGSGVMTLMSLMLMETLVRMMMTRSTASSMSYRQMSTKASMKSKKEMGQKCLISHRIDSQAMQVITDSAIRRRIQIGLL